MKRFAIFAVSLTVAVAMVNAQEEIGADDPLLIGNYSAQQELIEVSVERFEAEGTWYSTIWRDVGVTVSRLFAGGPDAKQPIPGEDGLNIPDDYVFGARVDFERRGHHVINITPVRPIPIEGVTKTVSVWVAGRNSNHELRLVIRDMRGRTHEVVMGSLNFQGWRQLTAAIPAQSFDGRNGVVQWDYRKLQMRMGIEILGFRIRTDPMEAEGSYYIYLDDLRAVTDVALFKRDPDDMVDGW